LSDRSVSSKIAESPANVAQAEPAGFDRGWRRCSEILELSVRLSEIDVISSDMYVDGVPHEQFASLRSHAPVHWQAGPEMAHLKWFNSYYIRKWRLPSADAKVSPFETMTGKFASQPYQLVGPLEELRQIVPAATWS
jgi:hypothetical protein